MSLLQTTVFINVYVDNYKQKYEQTKMNAYTIPKEPTKRTMARRLAKLEAKRDREIERKKFKLDEYEYKGFTIKRTRIQKWEVWKKGEMLKWFITLHEMKKYVEWKNEKEKQNEQK